MADAEEPLEPAAKRRRFWPQRKRFQFLLVLLVLLLATSVLSWRSRDDIANDLIVSQLDALGIEATYDIESIGIGRQVLSNFVVGDPANPDLTIDRVELVPVVRLFGADIGTLTLIRPRLRGSYRDGVFSLGALDPVFDSDSGTEAALPGWRLQLVDARARIDTDFGVLGAKIDGAGRLNGGFQGIAALAAPNWALGGCQWENGQIVGEVRTSQGRPYFTGPAELAGLNCPEQGVNLPEIAMQTSFEGDADFTGVSGKLELSELDARMASAGADGLTGKVDFDWHDGIVNSQYRLAAERLDSDLASLGRPVIEGALRYRAEDARWEANVGLSGDDLALGEGTQTALASAASAGEGTLLQPLLEKFRGALQSGLRSSRLEAEAIVRSNGQGLSLVIPAARVRDAEGRGLLSVSQGQWSRDNSGNLRLAGNFSTDGRDMPRIQGRIENGGSGAAVLRLQMAQYRADGSDLTVPDLRLMQTSGSAWQIAGNLVATGVIPGGRITQLRLPVSGSLSGTGTLALWQRCTDLNFARLELANLLIDRERIAICPDGGTAIVKAGPGGTRLAARIEGLDLTGRLGDSPIRLASGRIGLSDAKGLFARDIDVSLGETDEESQLTIAEIAAGFGDGASGTFSGISGGLFAVPLDIDAADGNWRFADGILTLSGTSFDLYDRAEEERFERLTARDATLTLTDGRINAEAVMRHPDSDRTIVVVSLVHDLANGTGFADLDVPGIIFDDKLEPGARIDQCDESFSSGLGPTGLTCIATGVVALAEGVVTGSGRIDWNPDDIVSTGSFSTDDFDFAAAFGPVHNVSGTVNFSDLVNLTTDGTQRLSIGTIDPGVEVYNGTLDFALNGGTSVSLRGGRWPFFGGTMYLRPVELDFSVSEERSYVIEITEVDAAQFIAAMEFSNISATGTFDGTVPLVFDESGDGNIVNGLLISRPPGGNLSYVGELTYEDMGVISNYAFRSLRSLDFNQMMVEMNGPLTGEIITRLLFDGVSQGQDADRNFITRQIAKLPIRFNVNVRASFYQLMNDLLRTYDPATNIDPGSLGLIRGPDGRMVRPSILDKTPPAQSDAAQDEPLIQTQESETLP